MIEAARLASATTVQTLLALGDEDFVRQAYRLVLGREADSGGLDNYLSSVRSGANKADLVAQLALSVEGRQRHATVPGLDALVNVHRIRPVPVIQRVLRRLLQPFRGPSTEPLERALRVIDNRLYRMEQTLAEQRDSVAALAHQLAQLQTASSRATQPAGPVAPSANTQGQMPRQAPPRVEQIYRELVRMATRRDDSRSA